MAENGSVRKGKVCDVRNKECPCTPTSEKCLKRISAGSCTPTKKEVDVLRVKAGEGNEKVCVTLLTHARTW